MVASYQFCYFVYYLVIGIKTEAISPVLEQSGTRKGIPFSVKEWLLLHRHFCSFRLRTDWMTGSPELKLCKGSVIFNK
jgi:hypothetical protein